MVQLSCQLFPSSLFSFSSLSLALMTMSAAYDVVFAAVVVRRIKRFLENVLVIQQCDTNEEQTKLAQSYYTRDIDLMHYRYCITASHQFFLYVDKCVPDFSFVLMPAATMSMARSSNGLLF